MTATDRNVLERAVMVAALTVFCRQHAANATEDWRTGLTCDERGCFVCNGDADEETAEWWLDHADEEAPRLPDAYELADALDGLTLTVVSEDGGGRVRIEVGPDPVTA